MRLGMGAKSARGRYQLLQLSATERNTKQKEKKKEEIACPLNLPSSLSLVQN